MKNILSNALSGVVELFKGYEEVIKDWGFNGAITDAHFDDDKKMISFLHDGKFASCPSQKIDDYRTRLSQEQIIRTWGYSGPVLNITCIDGMLSFTHITPEGNEMASCPAETQGVHKLKVQTASQIEAQLMV